MELRCELHPTVVAELLAQAREWAANGRLSDFDERVDLAGLDDDWLDMAIRRYRALASHGIESVETEHAALVSWLLSGEIGYGRNSAEFEAEMVQRLEDVEQGRDLIIIGWVVGRKVKPGFWGERTAAIPALPPSNSSVALAFQGLIEHAFHIGANESEAGELAKTSLVIRLGGLVDGISKPLYATARASLPQSGPILSGDFWSREREHPIDARLAKLHSQIKASLGFDDNRVCDLAIRDFNHHRNVLVHVDRGDAPQTFADYIALFADHSELATRVAAATVIVFGEVGNELSKDDFPNVMKAVDASLQGAVWAESF